MPIAPPLDKVPQIPVQIINQLFPLADSLVQQLVELLLSTVEEAAQLPDKVDCNDVRVQKIINQMNEAQNLISQIQNFIVTINQFVPILRGLIGTTQAIKVAAIAGAGPFAPAVIASQLVAVADLTISNTIEASKQFIEWPRYTATALDSLSDKLADLALRLAPICGNRPIELNSNAAQRLDDKLQKRIDESNNLLQSVTNIQRGLLTSLEEAPSIVIEGTGIPDPELGKPGDYFIDYTARVIYGPKPTRNDWGDFVNF